MIVDTLKTGTDRVITGGTGRVCGPTGANR
ncbi:hypothetical protein BH09ACT10_BH09ACT10_08160 [soil metagenome]